MSKVILRHLTLQDEEEFHKANNAEWGDFPFARYWEAIAKKDMEKFVEILPEFSKGNHLPEGRVPCTFLFAFNSNNEIIGRTSIRHSLTDYLLIKGGHIGFGVVPCYRRKGYAKAILKESLNYIREHLKELDKVLVTCDEGNIGSQKTIEANGGKLEDVIDDTTSEKRIMRFWITL